MPNSIRKTGIEGLASFGHEGRACRLAAEQQDKLKAWIAGNPAALDARDWRLDRAWMLSNTRPVRADPG